MYELTGIYLVLIENELDPSIHTRTSEPRSRSAVQIFISTDNVSLTLNISRGVLRGPPLVCYWLTSVEINKHKIFDTNNA